jgi:diguanylate cyclase (GGDEF)-like protein/PAS domain S-box-containing protein
LPDEQKQNSAAEVQKMISSVNLNFYKQLLDHMSDGVYFVDRDRRILYWNEGACRLTGYAAEEVIGSHCQDDILCHVDPAGKQLCRDGCPLSASIVDGNARAASVFLRHKRGGRVPVNIRVQPIKDANGGIIGAIEIFSDDSAQYAAQRKIESLERMAFLDHLTQLPNRRFLEMAIRTALSEFEVHKYSFGLLLIDLDKFKAINDSFGHSCGDRVLQEVARTLTGALRPTDIVGRWGGDEMLAIVGNVDVGALTRLAKRCSIMVGRMAIPGNNGQPISLTASIGDALVRPGETAEALIQRADERMYQNRSDHRKTPQK